MTRRSVIASSSRTRRSSSSSPAGSAAGCPAHVDENDLVSYGLLGLISAIERYDPERDVKFETYAITRIKGAIIDELRAMDWVPRSVRARAREIERAMASLEAQLHRAPTDAEIAEKIGITEEELEDSLHGHRALLDRRARRGVDDLVLRRRPGGADRHDRGHRRPRCRRRPRRDRDPGGAAESIAALPEREKIVITLYYYEELTLREIGDVLGVTESRVSQLHTKAILRLRSRLAGVQARALAPE